MMEGMMPNTHNSIVFAQACVDCFMAFVANAY